MENKSFLGGSVGRESACNARDPGLIPVSRRSLEKEMATHSSILAWRIPWIEEPGGLQSTGSKESDTTELLCFHFNFGGVIGDDEDLDAGLVSRGSQGLRSPLESRRGSLGAP